MFVLFSLVGVLLDLMLQMFTLFAVAASVAVVARGRLLEQWPITALFAALGALGLVVLARRIHRRERTITVVRGGSEDVSTVTWLHFVFDGLWLAALAMMASGAQEPPDHAIRAALVVALIACAGLLLLRIVVRVRMARTG